jgi:uncharacterized protein (TIGR02594 family)
MKLNKIIVLSALLFTSNCSMIFKPEQDFSHVDQAVQYIGLNERTNRKELQTLMDVDPVTTQWCAAFVNSVLAKQGIAGTEIVTENPLLARSFLDWGIPTDVPETGDIVVFKRGRAAWQGHVGIYIATVSVEGVENYLVLGGNQDNSVSLKEYPTSRLLGIRKIYEHQN